jgi:hypothetical protein
MASNIAVSPAPPAVGRANVDAATLWKTRKKIRSRIHNIVLLLKSRGFCVQSSNK